MAAVYKSVEVMVVLLDENKKEVETIELKTDYMNISDNLLHKKVEYTVVKKLHNTSDSYTLLTAIDTAFYKKFPFATIGEFQNA